MAWSRVAVLCAVLPAVLGLEAGAGARTDAHAAGRAGGAALMGERFMGASVQDPHLLPLGDACLTGASGAPPSGQSRLGRCGSSAGAPTAGEVPGYLQLTDKRGYRTGGVVYNQALPAKAGLVAEFETFQYGGTGADGISFFLSDGSKQLTGLGELGQALGYGQGGQTGPVDGVNGGYVGVGLDAWGWYSTTVYNLGKGCAKEPPGAAPNIVGLRGPGQGLAGYCWLTGTVGGDGRSRLPGMLRAAALADASRKVRVTVSPDSKPTITVAVDFADGKGYQQVLSHQMTEEAPATYKFGWAASTGGSTDTHLVRRALIRTVNPLDELSLIKQLDSTTAQPGVYNEGDTVPYQYVVTNSGSQVLTGVTIVDPRATGITCPATTLAPAGAAGSTMTCTGTHKLTAADVAADGTFTNTAIAAGRNPVGKKVQSGKSSVTVRTTMTPRPTPEPTPRPAPTPTPTKIRPAKKAKARGVKKKPVGPLCRATGASAGRWC